MIKKYLFKPSLFFCFYILVLVFNGCASAPLRKEYPIGYREVGLASWYGKDFHGRPTSSGEIYNMFGISAAHKTLPLGTLLSVTDRKTGRSVEVKVNDRGPFVGERILDLSFGAAQRLGIVDLGTAEVEIVMIGVAPIIKRGLPEKSGFIVQVGSYQFKENALRMQETVGRYYKGVYLEDYQSNTRFFYRVRIGPFHSDIEAQSVADKLSSRISNAEEIRPIVIRAD